MGYSMKTTTPKQSHEATPLLGLVKGRSPPI